MLYLKKKEITKNRVKYYYQPNKKGKFGILSYDPKNDLLIIEELAEGDYDQPINSYKMHAYNQLCRFYENNEYPEEKTIKWG